MDFSKFLMKRSTLTVIIFIVIMVGLYFYSNSKTYMMDRMTNSDGSSMAATSSSGGGATTSASASASAVNVPAAPISTPQVIPDGYNNKDIANPSDLLPKDMNSEWSKLNPVNTDKIIGSDLLDSAAFMGQVSQYKGIVNYDIRAWPQIPKQTVSPWLQSEFDADPYNIGLKV